MRPIDAGQASSHRGAVTDEASPPEPEPEPVPAGPAAAEPTDAEPAADQQDTTGVVDLTGLPPAPPPVRRGAIVIAGVELLATPLSDLVAGASGVDPIPWVIVSVIGTSLVAGGRILVGLGLTDLNPPDPPPFVGGP